MFFKHLNMEKRVFILLFYIVSVETSVGPGPSKFRQQLSRYLPDEVSSNGKLGSIPDSKQNGVGGETGDTIGRNAVTTTAPVKADGTTVGTRWSPEEYNIKHDDRRYYTSRTFKAYDVNDYWIELDDALSPYALSNSYRTAATVKLPFSFDFYGNPIDQVTIATGGFLYMSPFLHQWLTATQYIAPLMANFEIGNSSDIFYKGFVSPEHEEKFVVEWRNIRLQDQTDSGSFQFQTILYKNGSIYFVYKKLPVAVFNIRSKLHPVKIGLADAYYYDTDSLGVKIHTLYEYPRVTINQSYVEEGTVVVMNPVPMPVLRETTPVPTPSQHGCNFWSSLAYNLTHAPERAGDLMHVYCVNDNTDGDVCKEIKCGGRFQQQIPMISKLSFTFNFCFGFRLNECDDPVSMSYFFEAPERNLSLKGVLTHNDTFEIPGGRFQGIDTTVIVTIEMNQKDTQHIEFGITNEVRAELFGSPIFNPKMTVFPPTLIDITPCAADDKNNIHLAPFNPVKQCGLPPNYSTLTRPVTKPSIITSETYNKACEFGIPQCSPNEMCHLTGSRSRSGICVCQPLNEINPATGKCELSFPAIFSTTGSFPSTSTTPWRTTTYRPSTCGYWQFRCNNGYCISSSDRCDTVDDCGDYSDEMNCAPRTCSSYEWTCSSGQCICRWQLCNGKTDCRDGSDERYCDTMKADDRLFTGREEADGYDEDELGCGDWKVSPTTTTSRPRTTQNTCSYWQFTCNNGKCIDENERRCDGSNDCGDFSDEFDCDVIPSPSPSPASRVTVCDSQLFQCDNSKCIEASYQCDGWNDCGDYSDELDCATIHATRGSSAKSTVTLSKTALIAVIVVAATVVSAFIVISLLIARRQRSLQRSFTVFARSLPGTHSSEESVNSTYDADPIVDPQRHEEMSDDNQLLIA